MTRSLIVLLGLVAAACASAPRPGTESPANPHASSAPASPPDTSLAATDTPGLATNESGGMAAMDRDAGTSPAAPVSIATASAEPIAPSPPPVTASTDPAQLEREAFDRAHPVFVRFCADCHTTQGAHHRAATLRHFAMDGYPFGGHHAATMARTIREVLGVAGEPATMPDDHPGAVQGADLALVLAWADAWDRMHSHSAPAAGSAAPPHRNGAR